MNYLKKTLNKRIDMPVLLVMPLYIFMFSFLVLNVPIASGQSVSDLLVHFDHSGGDSWINTGNVGIGTNTPEKKLDVAGGIRSSESIDITGSLDPVSGKSVNLSYSTSSDSGSIQAKDWSTSTWKPIEYQASWHNF